MENMRYYEQGRSVPQDALKSFSNGRFSGTDINPMWRIKKLTEMFGPAGIGWYTEILRQDVVPVDDGNLMVFVDINLYVREGDEWSKPIFGTGGNTLKTKGRGDDDGFKKAYTDALSISCKALGIGADVWYANDTTSKYSDKYTDDIPARGSAEAAQSVGQRKLKELEDKMKNNGTSSDGQKRPFKRPENAVDKTVEQPTKAAQTASQGVSEASSGAMATDEQKKFIRQNATDEDYGALMAEYGFDLETLSAADAEREIKRIQSAIDSGHVACERCGKLITGIAMADGTTMTGAELIGKSKLKFGGCYCFSCMKELQKKRKAG